MFLIRAAFVVAIGVMLLPTDEAQQAKVAGQAGTVAERAATFCERNAATCAAGGELWATFVKKAEFGGKLAVGMVQDYMRGSGQQGRERQTWMDEPARAPQPTNQPPLQPTPARAVEPGRGTLAPGDLSPAWRGKTVRTGA